MENSELRLANEALQNENELLVLENSQLFGHEDCAIKFYAYHFLCTIRDKEGAWWDETSEDEVSDEETPEEPIVNDEDATEEPMVN